MHNKHDGKRQYGKGGQLDKKLTALDGKIGTILMAIKSRNAMGSQHVASNAMKAILLLDAIERFQDELEVTAEME